MHLPSPQYKLSTSIVLIFCICYTLLTALFLPLLPYFALVRGVHLGPHGTIIVPGEVLHVAEGHYDPVLVRDVLVGDHHLLEFLLAHLGAPDGGRGHPEQLPAGIVDSGEEVLLTISGDPLVVGQVGLLDAAVVRDVLSLGVDAVQLKGLISVVWKCGLEELFGGAGSRYLEVALQVECW